MDVVVLAVERIIDVDVLVVPFNDTVAMEVPSKSTRNVEVETGSVVDFCTTLVLETIVEYVFPGMVDVL